MRRRRRTRRADRSFSAGGSNLALGVLEGARTESITRKSASNPGPGASLQLAEPQFRRGFVLLPGRLSCLPVRVGTARRVWFAFVMLAVLLFAADAHARPVIPPEREEEVQALVLPHRLGNEVARGWVLQSIAIELATIRVRVVDGDGRVAEIVLDHPDYAPPSATPHESFAISIASRPSGSELAIEAVLAALERNDDGGFWGTHGTVAVDGEPDARFATGPIAWLRDGLVLSAIFVGALAWLLVLALRRAPRPIAWGLLGIVAVGAVLRVALAPATTLEPWSYTRFMIVARAIYEGPALALVHPSAVYMTELVGGTVLAYAVLAPVAVFLMARYTLDSDRAALVCAALVAVLPLHIRFSHGDVSSIPSLTISAAMFAMAHTAARDPDRRVFIAMLVLLPLPMIASFLLRPPNILYAPLMLALLFVHGPLERPRRVIAIALVVAVVTLGVGVPHLLDHFAPQVREGLSPSTLGRAARVRVSPEYNTLLNPRFTPPGLTVLAIIGAVDLARRKRWRLVACLAGWLLASLAVHAYVVPKSPFMQARYHLHLVLPFVCLAACGIEAVIDRHRVLPFVVFGYLAASPAIHIGFIRDVDFDDQREWAFVHRLRDTIPDGCTVVEYTGEGAGSRFARIGAHVIDGMPQRRWITAEGTALPDRECVYWYEGLPCFGQRPPATAMAPECASVHEHAELHEIDRLHFDSRPYDENATRALDEGEHVVLRLYAGGAQSSAASSE